MDNWTPLTIKPTESGRYIVGHRGHAEIWHYLDPDQDCWIQGAQLGWRSGRSLHEHPTDFNATHYMKLPEITFADMAEAKDRISDLTWEGLV